MHQYKGILINPQTREISEIALDTENSLEQLYHLIGCTMVDAVRLDNGDTAWIDDEGLLHAGQHFFDMPDLIPSPIGGCCVITGTDMDGRNIDYQHDLIKIMQSVRWLTTQQAMELLM